MVHRDMDIDVTGSIFAFPDWIGMTVVLSTVCVTIVAAHYLEPRACSKGASVCHQIGRRDDYTNTI